MAAPTSSSSDKRTGKSGDNGVTGTIRDATNRLGETYSEAKDSVSETLSSAGERASEAMDSASEAIAGGAKKAKEMATAAGEKAVSIESTIEEMTANHPKTMLGVALLAGFALGALYVTGTTDSRPRRRW